MPRQGKRRRSGEGNNEKIKQDEEPGAKKLRGPVSHPSHGKRGGLVLTLGEGDVGQLGLGLDIMERKRPAIVTTLADKLVVQLVCGGMHTVALTADGKLYTWGCNDEGALGRRTSGIEDESIPGVVELCERLVQVSAGDSHTVALTEGGQVYSWGCFRDANGPIGLTPDLQKSDVPKLTADLSSEYGRVVKVSSGNDHAAAITENGCLLTWGVAEQGQTGRIAECLSIRGGRKGLKAILTPGLVRFRGYRRHHQPFIADVFCIGYHTFAITDTNDVFAWGLNNFGQLGVGNADNQFIPCSISQPPTSSDISSKVCLIQFGGGQHHSISVDSKGHVYAMGRTDYGRLGLDLRLLDLEEDVSEPRIPVQISGLENVQSVAGGTAVSLAVTVEGVAYAWGMGTNYQLAAKDDEDVHQPSIMNGKNLQGREVISVSAGGQHCAILVSRPEENCV
jgi:regulator of chromosome condensation